MCAIRSFVALIALKAVVWILLQSKTGTLHTALKVNCTIPFSQETGSHLEDKILTTFLSMLLNILYGLLSYLCSGNRNPNSVKPIKI